MTNSLNLISLDFNKVESAVLKLYFDNIINVVYHGNYYSDSPLWQYTCNFIDILLINVNHYNLNQCKEILGHYNRDTYQSIILATNTFSSESSSLVNYSRTPVSVILKPLKKEVLAMAINNCQKLTLPNEIEIIDLNPEYLPFIMRFKQVSSDELVDLIHNFCISIISFHQTEINQNIKTANNFISFFFYELMKDLNDIQGNLFLGKYRSLLQNLKSINRNKSLLKLLENFLISSYFLLHPHYHSLDDERIDYIKRRIKHYINTEQSFSLESLASELHISTFYLSRIFKKSEHVQYKDYVNFQRLERAKLLLATTELSIEDIATKCSYSENSSFSRAFKNAFTITPYQYRKAHRKNNK